MKKALSIFIGMVLVVTMLASCGSSDVGVEPELPAELPTQDAYEPPAEEPVEIPPQELPELPLPEPPEPPEDPIPTPPEEPTPTLPIDPTGIWGDALEEYLAQFLPLFHSAGDRESPRYWWWTDWYPSDWWDFVEVTSDDPDSRRPFYGEYGVDFVFRNPMTGGRVEIDDDVPYLVHHSWTSEDDDGELRSWSAANIATHFELFFLDDTGIPKLLIYWNHPTWREPGVAISLHRFRDGSFEFVDYLSLWEWVGFYRAEDGSLLAGYGTTVAHMIDLRFLYINDEITTVPALSTDGWTGVILNHLTGEEFLQFCPDDRSRIGREYWFTEEWREESRLEYYLGMSLEMIEPEEAMHEQLMKSVGQRLREAKLIG